MEEKPHEPDQHHTPEHPKPKKGFSKWMYISIASALLILVLVCFGVFYFLNRTPTQTPSTTPSQTPNQATNWKTYTNTQYNFSIEYPDNWSLREFEDGAAFNPISKPGYPDASDSIFISVGPKIGNYTTDSLENYAKIAASVEIQNYNKLASINPVTTTNGVVGYETTWMIQPITGGGTVSESLPITYFEMPGNQSQLIRIYLERAEDLETYQKMIKTLKTTQPNGTPTPTVDEATLLKTVMKKYIALKHNSDENSLNVSVSKIEGNYAKGGVSDEGGGGMWFAAKEGGVWKLVWDGNGIISCSTFELYPNFPTSMVPECYDEATQNLVKR